MSVLTDQEKRVLKVSADCWNEYCELESVHPDEFDELKSHIHAIQCLIARRVARRVDPDIWI